MNEHRPFPSSNEVQVSASTFEDHRSKQADFAVIYDSPSIRAGLDVALFRKLESGEPSDKVLSWRAAIKRVTWQLLSKFLCSLSVCITWWSWNAAPCPEDTHKLSFHSYIITYRLQKLMQKICQTYPRVQTDSGQLAFVLWSTGDTSGGLLTCA